jgi:hypothetical protein
MMSDGVERVTRVWKRGLHAGQLPAFAASALACLTISLVLGAGQAWAGPALVVGESTGAVSAASAVLSAQINPNAAQTSYFFELRSSSTYGLRIPLSEASIGSGEAPVTVTQTLTGLSPNTTYHWRVVADGETGEVFGRDQTFIYDTSGGGLPDSRRYEMVTPPEKNGAQISGLAIRHPPAELSSNGQRVIAPADQCFAEPESCDAYRLTEGEPFEFERTASGWATRGLAPSAADYEGTSYFTINADAGSALFSTPSEPDGPDEFIGRTPGGVFSVGPFGEKRAGTGNQQPNTARIAPEGVVATADLDHVVFESEEPFWAFDASEHESVYEYAPSVEAVPLLVGVKGGKGSPTLISTCGTTVGGPVAANRSEAMSADGRTVYFSAAGVNSSQCGEHGVAPLVTDLYERVDGELEDAHTVLVSGPTAHSCTTTECEENTTVEANFRDADFEGASTDGSDVFFTSTQQLTDGASEDANEGISGSAFRGGCSFIAEEGGCNLYESVCAEPCGAPGEEPNAAGRELIDLSEGAKGSGGPRVQGVLAISPDGSHVYFVARGKLTGEEENANGEKAVDGEENLYMYTAGHLAFIARMSGTDAQEEEWGYKTNLIANVTPEGKFLVFTDDKALTPDDTREDSTPESEEADQVYEYDAETGVLKRISIGEDGFNDNGNAGTGNAYIAEARRGGASDGSVPVRLDPTMSADGELVFFESPIALAPGALNDVSIGSGKLAENVYEYYQGQVYLLSDGKDTTEAGLVSEGAAKAPTELLGVSTSGANVVFSTFDPLVGEDQDTQRDYYDAHVCSAEEPCVERSPAVVPCEEGSCQAPGGNAPGSGAPASETLFGPGNLVVPAVVKPPVETTAEKLAKALKACRVKTSKHKRTVCEASAHKRFPVHKAKPKKKKRKAKKSSVARRASFGGKGGE